MRVALVLVSHSGAVAEGTAEIAGQMAPDVRILAAGGADGALGTSVDAVLAAVDSAAADGAGVVVLTDLGSAVLTAESVVELVDDDVAQRVRVPVAPFVEGAVAAAVQAQQDGDLDAVAEAAVRAADLFAPAAGQGAPAGPGPTVDETDPGRHGSPEGTVVARVALRNPLGLHARPAAVLARAVAALGTPVTIDGANGASLLELMQLGATGGDEVTVAARGQGAQAAVDAVVEMIRGGFGEV